MCIVEDLTHVYSGGLNTCIVEDLTHVYSGGLNTRV